MNRIPGCILLPMLLLSPALPHPAAAAEPGEKWEQTVEMEMQGLAGMKMPATTVQFCKPNDGWSQPPSTGRDDTCKVKEFKQKGNRITWKVECSGEEPMTGEGEMTYSDDSFSGTSTLRMASGQEMRMKMKGRRLGGACDVGEERRAVEAKRQKAEKRIAEGQAKARESEKQQKEMCSNAASRLEYQLFTMPFSPCKDAQDRALLCSTATTREGLLKLNDQGPRAMKDVSKLCDEDLAAVAARRCRDASRDAPAGDSLTYLAAFCPEESRALAKKECAGRSYTGMPSTYREFCTEYASRNPTIVPTKDEVQGDLKDEVKSDLKKDAAKKVLKGLFGR